MSLIKKGQLPDDSYTFMVFVDAYNLREAGAYYGQGLTLQMVINREELETFTTCLEREYLEFKDRFQVDRQNEEKDRMFDQLMTGNMELSEKTIIREVQNGTGSKTKDSPELVQKKRSMIAEALATASKVKDKPRKKK